MLPLLTPQNDISSELPEPMRFVTATIRHTSSWTAFFEQLAPRGLALPQANPRLLTPSSALFCSRSEFAPRRPSRHPKPMRTFPTNLHLQRMPLSFCAD